MTKLKLFVMILLIIFTASLCFAQDKKSGIVEISFPYTKQSGFSSNQFAIWIENSNGDFIKTIYATKFTAKGGWEKRATSLPEWVKKSGLAKLSKTEIDSFSGATPATGDLKYIWNCTDKIDKKVAEGEYKFFIEATLRGEYRVIYTGIIKIGNEKNEVIAKAEYFGITTEKEKNMLGNVKAVYIP